MNTKTYLAVTLAALAAAVWPASASAWLYVRHWSWPSDPRVCSKWVTSAHPKGSPFQRRKCALHAAVAALKKHEGPAYTTCTKGSTTLRWNCAWGYDNPIGYLVVFKQSKGHWQVWVYH